MASTSASISVLPLIMAGGHGTRLWPLSRAGFPKQFLVLNGDESLFQQAALRLNNLATDGVQVKAPVVLGNSEHRFLVLEQLRELKLTPGAIVLEPMARNTAPALTMGALQAIQDGADPVLVVSAADQTIQNPEAYTTAVRRAIRQAANGDIVILGIQPNRPETGYGYIQSASTDTAGIEQVLRFVEKPNAETAERYLAEGNYSWNSGMFVLRASVWLAALQQFRPDIHQACELAWAARSAEQYFVRPGSEEFAAVPSESVDYAVMERCPGSNFPISMVRLDAGWSDLGAWDAVWDASAHDAQGNVQRGDVMFHDCHNSLAYSSERLVAVVGLEDVVVVETSDAVLVSDRSRAQEVKNIVGQITRAGRNEHTLHRKVHRPWGWYDSIDNGARFQVKRIMVKPGASLSLQMHHHRAEHWIVVSGTAEITVGERKILLTENQSTYIPLGEVHRLANPGKLELEIIEVQSGSYLGEDDIVRFEDTYGRR